MTVSSCVIERMNGRPPRSAKPEELGDRDPAGLLPELRRRDHGHEHLLAADRVHLLADDPDDLLVHAPAGRQEGPQPGADLADQPGPDEELVETASASAGSSRRVGRNSSDWRLTMRLQYRGATVRSDCAAV